MTHGEYAVLERPLEFGIVLVEHVYGNIKVMAEHWGSSSLNGKGGWMDNLNIN
jgi:hypothetical protein